MTQQKAWEGWQLGGSSAEGYERYLVPAIFAPWAERLVGLAGLRPGERVLDVACGTGIVARTAAPRVGATGTVVGVDANEEMLRVAERAAKGVTPAIDWKRGDVASLPVEDGDFDAAFCQQGLQFFPDRAEALREMRRALAPEGRLVVSVLRAIEHNPAYVPVADALERHAGADAGAMMRAPFPRLDAARLKGLARDAGFEDVRIRIDVTSVRYPSAAELIRREAESSPLAASLATLDAKAREALVHDVERALAPHTDDEGVVFPMETHVVIARR